MRFLTIIGARPQFIKAAPLSLALRQEHNEFLVHTGQHYDENMSAVFFRELEIPAPDQRLDVGSASHGKQTGMMLERIEQVLLEVGPDAVIVFGDTNSTLAGALAAAKLHIPVAHVEAGLRSLNRRMPEEVNRVLTDHVSRWLFTPSQAAVDQLAAEGICDGVHNVGDIMADCIRLFRPLADERSKILDRLKFEPGTFGLATIHRAENTDSRERLTGILETLRQAPFPVVLPLHPRTREAIKRYGLEVPRMMLSESSVAGHGEGRLLAIDPVGYVDMLQLLQHAQLVLTDSGGMQKEAYYLRVPCVTLRDETEWTETVDAGWNHLAGADSSAIAEAINRYGADVPQIHPTLYGDGHTADRIVEILSDG